VTLGENSDHRLRENRRLSRAVNAISSQSGPIVARVSAEIIFRIAKNETISHQRRRTVLPDTVVNDTGHRFVTPFESETISKGRTVSSINPAEGN